MHVPLEVAAGRGHLEVVHELLEEHGIEGCGGASGGESALEVAAHDQHVDIMNMLTSAGVVDTTGKALIDAAGLGSESSVKFLLQQQEWRASSEGAAYLDSRDPSGGTPLLCSMTLAAHALPESRGCSWMRERTLRGPFKSQKGGGNVVVFDDTPRAYAELLLSRKTINGEDATESQLHSLEATRRLLMRVEAVHAVPWLWASDIPPVSPPSEKGAGDATKARPTPLILILPILRRRAGRPRVLLAALSRHSRKPY